MLFFLILITYLDRICISIVGVRIKSEFNLSNTQFGWVLGAFSLAYALFEIPAGAMADRIGQKKVFIRIVIMWSLFTALTGATTGLATLLLTRFLFGAGEAGAFPVSTGTIARWMPAKETSRGTSFTMIGSSTGAALAPLIIVPVAQAFGWRAPFLVNGLIGLVWVVACSAWFKNEPSSMKNISIAEKKLIETNRRYINHTELFPWKNALKNKNLLTLLASFFCSQWALYFFIAWMPIYLQQGRHFSEEEMKTTTSLLFVIGIIGGVTGGFFRDWLVKKKGAKFSRRFVGVLALGMITIMFCATAVTSNNTVASITLICAYFFMPVNGINGFSTCIDIGESKVSTVTGLMNFAGNMGAFLLAVFFGKIADVTHSFNEPLFLIAGVVFAGSMLWLFVDPAKKLAINKKEGNFRKAIIICESEAVIN
jgi:sugar phosphate permease